MTNYIEYYQVVSNTVWSIDRELLEGELEAFEVASLKELQAMGFTFQRVPELPQIQAEQ